MDMWKCCKCGASGHLIATTPECPSCNNHIRCPYCTLQRIRSGHSYDTSSPTSNSTHYRVASPNSYTSPSAAPRHASIATTANTHRTSSTRGLSYGSYNYARGSQYAPHQGSHGAPGGSHGGDVDTYRPPSMAGWWKCCWCGERNNPVLCPERCSLDGHTRCGSCG